MLSAVRFVKASRTLVERYFAVTVIEKSESMKNKINIQIEFSKNAIDKSEIE